MPLESFTIHKNTDGTKIKLSKTRLTICFFFFYIAMLFLGSRLNVPVEPIHITIAKSNF